MAQKSIYCEECGLAVGQMSSEELGKYNEWLAATSSKTICFDCEEGLRVSKLKMLFAFLLPIHLN